MTGVPLGQQAYERNYAGEPEIRLENRFLEKNPTNQKEGIGLLTRPGSDILATCDSGGEVAGNRANFTLKGLFNNDLFVVSGPNLYRQSLDGTQIHIAGLVNPGGFVTHGWMKGIGYEYLFIADGLLLQFYAGGSHATGSLTGTAGTSVIQIGSTYYSWNAAVDTNAPDGSAAHPWLAAPGTDPLAAMANLLNFYGVRGVDFSTALGGPNPQVTAAVTGGPPATAMVVTARTDRASGNTIQTVVTSGAVVFSNATLTGGGVHALEGVEVPDGAGVRSLTSLSGYVLASIADSQMFRWLEPGTVVFDPLNFAEKESNPDNIVDMVTIGDQAIICGEGSTENWYASGDFNAPFLPVEGRVYRRGIQQGTAVAVKDSLLLVGDDGIVYSIGYAGGDTSNYGVHRISTHAIEERIRVQLRREQGLP
jgi:hypothetical protein